MSFWGKVGGAGKKIVNAPVDQAKAMLAVDEAKKNFQWMRQLAKGLLPSSIKVGMVETFEHAVQRQGVTEEGLGKIYTNHVLKFWICVLFLVVTWIIGLSFMESAFYVILPVIGFSALCLANMFAASFRAYQIANRKFCDVSEWLSNKQAWVPTSFVIPPKKKPSAQARAGVSAVKRPKNKEQGKS